MPTFRCRSWWFACWCRSPDRPLFVAGPADRLGICWWTISVAPDGSEMELLSIRREREKGWRRRDEAEKRLPWKKKDGHPLKSPRKGTGCVASRWWWWFGKLSQKVGRKVVKEIDKNWSDERMWGRPHTILMGFSNKFQILHFNLKNNWFAKRPWMPRKLEWRPPESKKKKSSK